MPTGVGFNFDFSSVFENAKKADKVLENMVTQSEQLYKNMHQAFNVKGGGGMQQYIQGLQDMQDLVQQISGSKLTIETDTGKLNQIEDAISRVIDKVDFLNHEGVEIFDTKGLYATNQGLLTTEDNLSEIIQRMAELREKWKDMEDVEYEKSPFIPKGFEPKINEKTGKPYGENTKVQKEAFAAYKEEVKELEKLHELQEKYFAREFEREKRRKTFEIELEMEALKEREAIEKQKLKFASMTQDQKAEYLKKKADEILREEQKNISKLQSEYKKLWADLKTYSSSRGAIEKAAEGKTMTTEQQSQYDTLIQLEQETEAKIQAMYQQHQETLSDITVREMAKRSKAIAEELKKQKFDAPTALNMAANARTGEQMERAKEAVKGALMTVDKDDAVIIEKLNKAYIDLRASIEKLTKAQKNEQTLQPTLRNEYARILAEIDKVTEAKKRLEVTEAYTKGDTQAMDDYKALEARENDLMKRKAEIRNGNEALLTEIETKHEADRAQKRTEALLKYEEELKKFKEKYGAISSTDVQGVLVESENTENVHQSEKAIHDLREARDKLNKNDADYTNTLEKLNEEIKKHEEYIESVTDAEKYREKQEKKKRDTFAGAMNYSKEAKSINELQQAIKHLETARSNENTKTRLGKARYQELTKEIERQKKVYQSLTGEIHNSSKGLLNYADQLKRSFALIFSISQIRGYINNMMQVRGEFELQQRSLETLLQNKDEANRLWQQTVDLAVKSPFRVKELVTYTKQLAAYGIESEKLHKTTKMLADVSAGLGVDMDRLNLAYGQIRSAAYLRGTELRQLTEAGVPILEELSKYFSEIEGRAVSVGEVFSMISKRMVAFEDVEEVFRRITSAGGEFYKMQEIQSETLKGQISNLKDSVDLMMNEIGESTEGVLKSGVGAVKTLVENWERMVPVLKSIIALLAIYKVSSFLAKDSTIQWARGMGEWIEEGQEQLKLSQLLTAGWTQVEKAFSKMWKNMKNLVTKNPWAVVLTAVLAVMVKLIAVHREHEKALQEISDKYQDMRDSINEITFDFYLADDFEEKKSQLTQLVSLAEKDYNIKFNIEIGKMSEEEVEKALNELRQDMLEQNASSEKFAIAAEKSTHYTIGKDMFEDMESLKQSTTELNRFLVTNAKVVAGTLAKAKEDGKELSEEQEKVLDILSKPLGEGETEGQYFERLREGFNMILSTQAELKKNNFSESVFFIKDVGLIEKFRELYNLMEDFDKSAEKASEGYNKFLKTLDRDYYMSLPEEDRTIYLKTAIDKLASEKEWGNFVNEQMYVWTNEPFNVKITPIADEEAEEQLLEWQKTYNKKFVGDKGFKEIEKGATLQSDVIKRLQEEYSNLEDIINAVEKAGGESATAIGGAYEGVDLQGLKTDLKEVNAQLEWLGGAPKGEKARSEESVKILNKRINLIKEMHNEYLKVEKTAGDAAEKQVQDAYTKTFKEAFEGTGINLTGLVIDKEKLTELQNAGDEAGKVFSEAMLSEMNKMAEEGTYIRNFTEDTLALIKKEENAILTAKDVEKKGKGFTIGYGEYKKYKDTGKTIQAGDTMTEEEAAKRLAEVVLPKYRDELNAILDVNNDLIFTQEQYNALLDMTFQGGAGAAKSLIKYARDEAEGLEHITNIQKKVNETFGEEAASRFGEAFVNKFKEAENIYDRMAILLETMNLTVSGGVNEELYKGMQGRSDRRAALFRGDLEIVKLLQKSAIDVSQVDFTNIEGVVALLKQLKPIAQKEGEEAVNTLNQAISKFEAEIGLTTKKDADKKILDKIQEDFNEYELSLQLKKLNIPPDLAKNLFNVDYLNLDELKEKTIENFAEGAGEGSEKLIEELDKGLTDIDWNIVKGIVGEDQMKKIKERLEEISKLENDLTIENMKNYIKYAETTIGERAKIKLEELKKLKEIEETFAEKEGDSEETKAYKSEQKKLASDKAREEAKKALEQFEWGEFQKSDMFINLFDDLDSASESLINHMIGKLREFKAEWTDMPLEDVKRIIGKINELETALVEIKPGEKRRESKQRVKEAMKNAKFESEEAQKAFGKGRSQTAYMQALQMENVYQEQKKINAQEELGYLETALRIKEGQATGEEKILEKQEEYNKYLKMTPSELKRQISAQKTIIKNAENILGANEETLTESQKQAKALLKQSDNMSKVQDMANDLYNAFKEITEVLGVDEDSPVAIFADMGMNMLNTVLNTIQLQMQLRAATLAADGLGKAMNTAMGVVGWIVMAVQLITQAISAVVNAKAKQREREIEKQTNLVSELEEKYDKLADKLDEAWNLEQIRSYNKEMQNTITSAIYAQKAILTAMETNKKVQKALEGDESAKLSDEYKDYLEAQQKLEELKQMSEDLKEEIVSIATSGILDSVHDAARDFTDAWYDAFSETGKGIDGLEENFNEMFMDLAKNQASMLITGKFVDDWKKSLDKYVNEEDTELSVEEARKWAEEVRATFPELNSLLEAFLGTLHNTVGGTAQGLSALQKGISGITAEQADILAAYWNSVRGYTANIDSKLGLILQNMNINANIESNPVYQQIKAQTDYLKTIKQVLSDTTKESTAIYVKLAGQR